MEVERDERYYLVDSPEIELTVVGRQSVEVELRLRLGGSVSGRLKAPSSEGQDLNYLIHFRRVEGSQDSDVIEKGYRTRPGGNYGVNGLPPGKYRVRVYSVIGRESDTPPVDLGEVDVRPGEVTQLNIDLARSEQSR